MSAANTPPSAPSDASPLRPLPEPSAWSAPFWQAARDGQLLIQTCDSCSAMILYPRRFCPECLSDQLSWRRASGRGEIYTLTTQMAGPPSGFEALLPYVIAVIRLEEGVQMMSNLVGAGALEAKIGDRVQVDFHPVPDSDTVLPVFRLAPLAQGEAG